MLWVGLALIAIAPHAALKGQGTASLFAPAAVTLPPALPFSDTLDFDQDGSRDRFIVNSGVAGMLYGRPDGSFSPARTLFVGGLDSIFGVSFVDLNLDERLDIIATELDPSRTIVRSRNVYLADGTGGVGPAEPLLLDPALATFPFTSLFPTSIVGQPSKGIVAMGFNSLTPGPTTRHRLSMLLRSPGTNSWVADPIGEIPIPSSLSSATPAAWNREEALQGPRGDFNGDGTTDWLLYTSDPLAVPSVPAWTNGPLAVLYGLNQAPWFDFSAMQIFSIPAAVPTPGLLRIGANHEGIEVTDYNRDGYSDLVMLRDTRFAPPGSVFPTDITLDLVAIPGGMGLALGGRWVETRIMRPILGPLRLFDYDNDELLDFAGLMQVPAGFEIQVWRGHEDGSFSSPISRSLPAVLNTSIGISVSDDDADGDLDLTSSYPNGQNPGLRILFENESLMRTGAPAANGRRPRIFRGNGQIGNPRFFIEVRDAPPSAPAVLALSLAPSAMAGPIGVDMGQLLWPLGAIGPRLTDASGRARLDLSLPTNPSLAGLSLYFQWAVATPTSLGFCATQTAKVILWL